MRRRWSAWPWSRPDPQAVDADLASRLQAFGAALDPETTMLDRRRAQLMAEFSGASRVSPIRSRRSVGRLAATLAAATALVAVSFSTVAASSDPGEPFYGLRLALEQLMLPAEASVRAVAQLDRLEERLSETREAVTRGDERGVVDALAAYNELLADTIAPGVGTRAPELDVALGRHQLELEALGPTLPTEARAGFEQALVTVESARGERPARAPASPGGGGPPSQVPGARP